MKGNLEPIVDKILLNIEEALKIARNLKGQNAHEPLKKLEFCLLTLTDYFLFCLKRTDFTPNIIKHLHRFNDYIKSINEIKLGNNEMINSIVKEFILKIVKQLETLSIEDNTQFLFKIMIEILGNNIYFNEFVLNLILDKLKFITKDKSKWKESVAITVCLGILKSLIDNNKVGEQVLQVVDELLSKFKETEACISVNLLRIIRNSLI